MDKNIKIPSIIKFRIYFSLLITLFLFISIYVSLFIIGGQIAYWWEIPESSTFFGIFLVILGCIPLIIALFYQSSDRGYTIKEKEFPKLVKIINEVADDLGIKRPTQIQILPTGEIYVTGFFVRKIGIGIAGLRGISKEQFKSILYHEFGHLYGNDTIIGALLSKIEISLEKSSKFGKAWWEVIPLAEIAIIGIAIAAFSKAYSFIFRIIISIYIRQVEYRADYIAAKISNKENFASALLNYSAYTTYFDNVGYNSIISLLQEGKQFINIYDAIDNSYKKEDIKKIKNDLFENDKQTFFSSHPSLKNRFANIDIKEITISKNINSKAIETIDKYTNIEKDFTSILTKDMHVNLLYADAVAREGHCRYCGNQFETLQELLEHEEKCYLEKMTEDKKD